MIDYSVYVVDDEVSVIKGLQYGLKKDYPMKSFGSAEEALIEIKKTPPDLVLLDIGLPGMSGLDALKEIKKINPQTLVIMITAFEDIDSVLTAMKAGAQDYVVKPIDLDSLKVTIKNALETVRLQKEVQVLQEKYLRAEVPCFISESNAISDTMHLVEKAAKSPDTPILITGESGTGKEIIASAIHYKSPNYKGPFIAINCASIPQDLVESELFGYEKGAFSGANPSGKKGMIEKAQGGTLFLDEMGELSLDAQAKLLRFLEEGEFYRVGGTRKMTVETRVVSATNRNIETMIEDGRFRLDLYYRIGVIKVEIPSLNERTDDVIPLAKYFLTVFAEKMNKRFTGLSKKAVAYLQQHKWQGNVRELKNIIERGVLIDDGPEITLNGLGADFAKIETDSPQGAPVLQAQPEIEQQPVVEDPLCTLDEAVSRYILKVLSKTDGRIEGVGGAAEILDLNPSTLRSKMRKLNISYQKNESESESLGNGL